MSQSNLQTDQARARWAAEYREARKVRGFERALLPNAGLSSLSATVPHDAYIAALHSEQGVMMFARRNGRYGVGGRTKRFMCGHGFGLRAHAGSLRAGPHITRFVRPLMP